MCFVLLLGFSILACKEEYVVTPKSSLLEISINAGESKYITLPIGYSPGSTGVMWYVSSGPNTKIAKTDSGTVIDNNKKGEIWGNQLWKITGVSKGTTKILFRFGIISVPAIYYGEYLVTVKTVN